MSCRILIIDSDDNSRTILSRRLRRRGFEIFMVEEGNMAIAEALSVQPDVILMDLSVVTTDCWQTAREIKKHAELGRVPIVAISVLDLTWDQEAAMHAGCDVYLPKPVDMDMLGRILQKISDGKCVPEDVQ